MEILASDPPPQYMIITAVVCSTLSLIGSGCMLISFLITKSYRAHFYFYWVFHLSVADFFISAGGLYDWTQASDKECKFFSVILGFGLELSFYFISYIAIIMYYSTSKQLENTILFNRSLLVVILTYVFVLGLAIGPLFTDSYGVSSTFCWLQMSKTNTINQIWTFVEYYIPIVGVTILTTILYCKIYFLYKEDIGFGVKTQSFVYLFILIPVVYLITNVVSAADRILNFEGDPTPWIQMTHILLRQLQGFYHAIIYGYTSIKYTMKDESINLTGRVTDNSLTKAYTKATLYGYGSNASS